VSQTLVDLFAIVSLAIFVVFLIYNLFTLALIAFSAHEVTLLKEERGDLFRPTRERPLRPGISVLAAAYNERPVILSSVRSLLASDYDPLEVVVVDDGSTDGTFEALHEAFDLVPLPVGDRFQLETEQIEALYVSRTDPRLRVARKQNGGRSDALNAGFNLAYQELVATVDADSLLDRDALARIVEVFAADPDRVIAVGGTIRIANGAVIENGIVTLPRVPVRGTQASQVGEYLRGFLGARIAWAAMNGLLIISGAFGVFRRDLFRAVGGLSRATMGEDMELVMRMHQWLRPDHPELRIAFAPDATSWTEVPSGLGPLRGQRVRWHIGLLDNLRLHKPLWRWRYGALATLALPYTLAFEVIAPLLQVAGYAILIVLLVFHQVAFEYAIAFLIGVLLFGQLQTAGAILIEEIGFERYRTRDLFWIGGWGLLETFWYRPLTALWRAWATVLWLTGTRASWGTIPRGEALGEQPGEVSRAPEPAPLSR
jgi:cellulose synthase/poly-beta-1,6-N-acetylglucosamine synthase-like glycosyltransferase